MASAVVGIIFLLFAEFTGKIAFLWFLLGSLAMLALLREKHRPLSIYLGVCGLCATSWIARDFTLFGAGISIFFIYRSCVPEASVPSFSGLIFWVTVGIFGLFWDWPLLLGTSVIGIIWTLPVYRLEIPRKLGIFASVLVVLLALWAGFLTFKPLSGKRVAYIEHGKWATADVDWKPGAINMQSAYSYTEFVKLVSGERISLTQLTSEFGEAWLITPTKPISEEELILLDTWVLNGGHLILVTDHTDVFGHCRVANQYLQKLGLFADYTGFFPIHESEEADGGWFEKYALRTTNTFRGLEMLPTVTARWFNEASDYSTKNFFGRLRATGEDEHARRAISGIRAHGNGSVELMGDSTMFSNFATFSPGSAALAGMLKSPLNAAHIYQLFPWILALACIAMGGNGLAFTQHGYSAILVLCMFPIAMPTREAPLHWGEEKEFMWWAGDRDLVEGMHSPQESLSTAFTIASLSGSKPRWTEQTDRPRSGIWISRKPPPNAGWRWISPEVGSSKHEREELAFSALHEVLNAKPLLLWTNASAPGQRLDAGGLWTNSVLGNEWFDRGVSPARQERFEALWSWIRGGQMLDRATEISPVGVQADWVLKVGNQDTRRLRIPIPLGKDGEFIYFGNGVSGQWTSVLGKPAIVGLKPFAEDYWAPDGWVLRQAED